MIKFLGGVACGIVVAFVGSYVGAVWYLKRNDPMG